MNLFDEMGGLFYWTHDSFALSVAIFYPPTLRCSVRQRYSYSGVDFFPTSPVILPERNVDCKSEIFSSVF